MPNYKKMYFDLFNAVTDSIHALQKAQQNGESSYIESETPILPIVSAKPEQEKQAPNA